MNILGWVLLALGVAAAVLAINVFARSRMSLDATKQPDDSGLVIGEAGEVAPKTVRPGMLDALSDGEISLQDLLITMIDLAARGYLVLEPQARNGQVYDWLLIRTLKPDDGLQDFEKTLLRLPFEPASEEVLGFDMESTNPWDTEEATTSMQPLGVHLSELVNNEDTVQRALKELQEASEATGWFDGSKAFSVWGSVGAVVLLLGLVALAAMFITGMRNVSPPGFIGSALLTLSGVAMASTSRLTVSRTDAGQQAKSQVERYKRWLRSVQPHQILPETAGDLFNTNLAAALALGMGDQFAAVFAEAAKRMSAWGNKLPLKLGWLSTMQLPESGHAPATPAAAVALAREFISDGRSAAGDDDSD